MPINSSFYVDSTIFFFIFSNYTVKKMYNIIVEKQFIEDEMIMIYYLSMYRCKDRHQ